MQKDIDTTIAGVVFKKIETHADERGFFREIIRCGGEDSTIIGQVSHSLVYAGTVKAWHAHKIQTQWNYVLSGLIKVVLYDLRKDSPTYRQKMEFLSGDYQVVQVYGFPPGILHGYRCISGPMHIIYVTSGTYDTDDEVRIPHDDPAINYDWTEGIKIR